MPQAASTLTLHEGLSLAISAAGFVAVIASILLLLRQTRELSRQTSHIADSARADVFDRVQAQMFIIDQLFVTHPELRPYFYEGKPPDDEQLLRQRLLAAAEMILDVFEVIVLHQKYFVGVWPGGDLGGVHAAGVLPQPGATRLPRYKPGLVSPRTDRDHAPQQHPPAGAGLASGIPQRCAPAPWDSWPGAGATRRRARRGE